MNVQRINGGDRGISRDSSYPEAEDLGHFSSASSICMPMTADGAGAPRGGSRAAN